MTDTLGTTLITGASGGIGYEIARRLATRATRLVLVARSAERLEEVAAELRHLGAPQVDVLPADLATGAGTAQLLTDLGTRGITVDTLINNAGYGAAGEFATLGEREQLEMVQLNVAALTHLTRQLLPPMLARRNGRILNVASTAGFQPGPYMGVYYATKAYVLSFSEGIRKELEGTGVVVTTLCPGPTATGFADRAGVKASRLFTMGVVMEVGVVADQAVARLERGGLVIPGIFNKLLVQGQRISPRSLTLAISAALNRSRS